MRWISRRRERPRIRIREHFMPPPVDPAQAPQNMIRIRMRWDSWGHRVKSAVAKPVVEMMEATWNTA